MKALRGLLAFWTLFLAAYAVLFVPILLTQIFEKLALVLAALAALLGLLFWLGWALRAPAAEHLAQRNAKERAAIAAAPERFARVGFAVYLRSFEIDGVQRRYDVWYACVLLVIATVFSHLATHEQPRYAANPLELIVKLFSTPVAAWATLGTVSASINLFGVFYSRMLGHHRRDIERQVRLALPNMPAVAVGRIGSDIDGVWRIEADEAGWRDLVERLLANASVIIVASGPTAGMLWEIERIKALNLVERCVFVMAPSNLRLREGGEKVAALWSAGAKELGRQGLALPVEHAEEGAVFVIDGVDQPPKRYAFGQFHRGVLRAIWNGRQSRR